ncbi:hypothetical protein Dimus_020053 [Dionaea muscipula]
METDAEASSSWSEKVEDLIESGDSDAAISLLETLTSKLTVSVHHSNSVEPQLASALFELAELYASKGLSLKADETRSRAAVHKSLSVTAHSPPPPARSSSHDFGFSNGESEGTRVSRDDDDFAPSNVAGETSSIYGNLELSEKSLEEDISEGASDDDWEAAAEHAPDELLPLQSLPEVPKPSIEASEDNVPKRRGRGTFSYRRYGLYSDQQSNEPYLYDQEDCSAEVYSEGNSCVRNSYGTRHVLILDGFQPSSTTSDLEKLFGKFKDHEFVIRWINDTVAMAVFCTPSLALEACNTVHCTFSVRVLEDDDTILGSISARDLEPPRRRPQTSARTAQRLIAQSTGLKLPSSTFGVRELRKQEEARRNRIVRRQNLIEDAWGADNEK